MRIILTVSATMVLLSGLLLERHMFWQVKVIREGQQNTYLQTWILSSENFEMISVSDVEIPCNVQRDRKKEERTKKLQ